MTEVTPIVLALLWPVSGLAAAVVLSRRGHDLRSLLGLALVFGPLFVPLAVLYAREEQHARLIVVDEPQMPVTATGGDRVVVLLHGEPESVADARPTLEALDHVETVVLATFVDYEAAVREERDGEVSVAQDRLRRAAVLLQEFEPTLVLIPGPPSHEPRDLDVGMGDLVLVVGDSSENVGEGATLFVPRSEQQGGR